MNNKSANKCDVSVVIRVRNEEQWIGYAIQSLLDFLLKPEIVIIENKSTDESFNFSISKCGSKIKSY